METYEIKTEQAIFLVRENEKNITISLIEDLTDSLGMLDIEVSENAPKNIEFHKLIKLTNNLFKQALKQKKNASNKGKAKPVENVKYNHETIDELKDEFLEELNSKGRVPFQLENKSVITVCAPLVGFENKDEDFKASRLQVEKNYWIKQIENERSSVAYKKLAELALKLF